MTAGLGFRVRSKNDNLCFASSCSFPMSETNPLCGLASFYTSTTSLLTEECIDSCELPKSALCVIIASSAGDLTAQTLLASPHYEERRSNIVLGDSIGSCVVTVPPKSSKSFLASTREQNFVEQSNLLWTLENGCQPKSKAILKHHVASRSQCRNFETIQLSNIPPKMDVLRDSNSGTSSIGHPSSETFMASSKNHNQSTLHINSQYVKNTEQALRDDQRSTNQLIDKNMKSISQDFAIDLNKSNIKFLRGSWNNAEVPFQQNVSQLN